MIRGVCALLSVLLAAALPVPAASAAIDNDRQEQLWRPGLPVGSGLGTSVALSANGRVAAVGMPGYAGTGGVGLYYGDGSGSWSEGGTLVSPDQEVDAAFGATVALSGDGDRLMVGIPFDDVAGRADQGRVAVFDRSNAGFDFVGYLVPPGAGAGDHAGFGLDLSADGSLAVVGSPDRDVFGEADQGSVTVFARQPNGAWQVQATYTAPQGRTGDRFGLRSALSSDGGLAAVGVPGADPLGRAGAGAVVMLSGRDDWQEATVATLRRGGAEAGEALGSAVDVSADGSVVLSGAPGYSQAKGAAVVFASAGDGTWNQEDTLTRALPLGNDQLGTSVALTPDASTAVVGVPYAPVNGVAEAGVLQPFTRAEPRWTRGGLLSRANAAPLERLGTATAVSPDGLLAIGGAPGARIADARTGAAVSFAAPPPQELLPARVTGTGVVGTPLDLVEPLYRPAMQSVEIWWLSCAGAVAAGGDLDGADCRVVARNQTQYRPDGDDVGRHITALVWSATSTRAASSTAASVGVSAAALPPGADPPATPGPPNPGASADPGAGAGPVPPAGSPRLVTAPALRGPARVGRRLTTTNGTWDSDVTVTVQWLSCRRGGGQTQRPPAGCKAIPGATGATMTPDADQLGRFLRAQVTATSSVGSTSAVSVASARVKGLWVRSQRVRHERPAGWSRLFGTASDGTRSMVVRSGDCAVRQRRLVARSTGSCRVRAVVRRDGDFPKLRKATTIRVR